LKSSFLQFIPEISVDWEMQRLVLPLLLLACLCSLQSALWGQYQLVLENANALKRHRIERGDEIGIRVRGMDQIYAGQMERVKAEKFYIFGDSLAPDSIDRIRIARPRGGINMLRGALVMTAIIYPVMMVINLPRDRWTLNRAAITASICATALILQKTLKIAYWKRYRLDRGPWRLRIMPTVDGLF
jgi:hypothetical protein